MTTPRRFRPPCRVVPMLLLLPLFFLSCEKDPDLIGMDITPAQDAMNVTFTDTFTIVGYSVPEDSLSTAFTSYNITGSMFDPVFGRTSAAFVTQFNLPSVSPDFGTNPALDSLILFLSYGNYYGDTGVPQTFRVYVVNQDLPLDSAYYSTERIDHQERDYAHYTFLPRPTDSVRMDTLAYPPFVRINLSEISRDLGEHLLYTPADYLGSNTEFIKHFRGLYIESDPVAYRGALLMFKLQSSYTRLRMYYHNDSADSLAYDFIINENCTRLNLFNHHGYDFANQALRKQVVYGDTSLGKQLLYVQGLAGLKVKLQFPYLKQWAASHKYAINEAQLILPVQAEEPLLKPPSRLLALAIGKDGSVSFPADYNVGTNHFDGYLNEDRQEYRFRLTQHIQDILTGGTDDHGLYLVAQQAAISANRVVLNGTAHTERPVRLKVVYSYLP